MNEIVHKNLGQKAHVYEQLRSIIEMQSNGDTQGAHDAFVDYFERNEIDYPALNLFGVCCMQLGKHEKAKALFQYITAEAPEIEGAFINLVECHIITGDAVSALSAIKKLKKFGKHKVRVSILAAKAHHMNGDISTALKCLQDAAKSPSIKREQELKVAEMQLEWGNHEEAGEIYNRILFDDPQDIEALLGQSQIYFKQGNWGAVIVNTRGILALCPENQQARFLECLSLIREEKFDDLLVSAKHLSQSLPEHPMVLEILSQAYIETGDNHAALMSAQRLLQLDPKHLVASQVVAAAYHRLGLQKEAIAANTELLNHHPKNLQAIENIGVSLERLLRLDEAIVSYDTVLEMQPESPGAKFNKSISLLLKGNLKEGLALYESRFKSETEMLVSYLGDEPIWDGQSDISGKHLLIHPEQGYGDTLMFCRLVKYMEGKGAKLTFAAHTPLFRIMKTLDCQADLISVGEPLKNIDLHVPLMSLAHIAYDEWSQNNERNAYLKVPEEASRVWAKKLGKSDNLRIGFVCSGNPEHKNDKSRSLNMKTLLDALPRGPEYHLLQKEVRETDRLALSPRKDIYSHEQEINDFADTAAIAAQMDFVVSVDTSVAHLAGAIGKKTFLLLPWWPDWRWGEKGRANSWYKDMQSLRQHEHGDWSQPLRQLASHIQEEMVIKMKRAKDTLILDS